MLLAPAGPSFSSHGQPTPESPFLALPPDRANTPGPSPPGAETPPILEVGVEWVAERRGLGSSVLGEVGPTRKDRELRCRLLMPPEVPLEVVRELEAMAGAAHAGQRIALLELLCIGGESVMANSMPKITGLYELCFVCLPLCSRFTSLQWAPSVRLGLLSCSLPKVQEAACGIACTALRLLLVDIANGVAAAGVLVLQRMTDQSEGLSALHACEGMAGRVHQRRQLLELKSVDSIVVIGHLQKRAMRKFWGACADAGEEELLLDALCICSEPLAAIAGAVNPLSSSQWLAEDVVLTAPNPPYHVRITCRSPTSRTPRQQHQHGLVLDIWLMCQSLAWLAFADPAHADRDEHGHKQVNLSDLKLSLLRLPGVLAPGDLDASNLTERAQVEHVRGLWVRCMTLQPALELILGEVF